MFQLRVDTGGTFTDCRGQDLDSDSPNLVKVLSSGVLRISVLEQLSPTELRVEIPAGWKTSDGFFTSFTLQANISTRILGFDRATSTLQTEEPVDASETVDLSTGEEAPVIGARLLTGTSLSNTFPPMDFRLATTRGTNALLERKGAPLAFFTTKGFADLLIIGDQRRSDLFALKHHRAAPLFANVVEVEERLDESGKTLSELNLSNELDDAVATILEKGIRVAAVALLHSYRNPEHEKRLKEYLIGRGFEHVSLSSDLAPLIKMLPRARTAVTNAYLHPVMQSFLDHIHRSVGTESPLLTMTSAGGLEPIQSYTPKDALLSGPAGGVAGAAAEARDLGFDKILTFDMGGTSTDVARYDGDFVYQFEHQVGDANLLAPALKIETVAAGGGSICQWRDGGLHVGPESAGADPGPACYGRGGPLTITDVNLLLGRIDPDNFGIPMSAKNIEEAKEAARSLQKQAGVEAEDPDSAFLEGLLDLATEQMADAIRTISVRDGADPQEYALLAFGGAGPLHACDIAERLDIEQILIPKEAGLLSAYGLDQAEVERFAESQINLVAGDKEILTHLQQVEQLAISRLSDLGYEGKTSRNLAEIRLLGQDATLSIEIDESTDIRSAFGEKFQSTFGYAAPRDREIEVVSIRSIARTEKNPSLPVGRHPERKEASPRTIQEGSFVDRTLLNRNDTFAGPGTIQDPFSTLYLKRGWIAEVAPNHALILRTSMDSLGRLWGERPPEIIRELFRHRFEHLVEEMGTMLQRAAISTNVKERADYSCALLNAEGELVTSAPHIPVHLGALGLCVREVSKRVTFSRGDTVITNHPGIGGSHLPDVTLITPIFDGEEQLVGYVANRAHHAEIGGISPGSMPPHAENLAEEGVVISPRHLIRRGASCFEEVERLLRHLPYPSRNLPDNLADLNAQLAANLRGVSLMESLLASSGTTQVQEQLTSLTERSREVLASHLESVGSFTAEAAEKLDDGSSITIRISNQSGRLHFDFSGTAETHPGNLNATPAIVQSAILYLLRLWTQSAMPLNEGMLDRVDVALPRCFLNPEFPDDPKNCPAVVGGNVETSQRLVDTLLKALNIQACSQGTMNNLIFGNDSFGYYETICGGSGAGDGYDGTSGIHTHMTNTAITDPEILESRYPVRLHEFSIRNGSGGKGTYRGGDGIVRRIEFLKKLDVSLLTQHRSEEPYGCEGGAPGEVGRQTLNGKPLEGITSIEAKDGDILLIETPGGGGWGKSPNEELSNLLG